MEIDRGKKLLLVEDEAIIAMVTAKMLKKRGYEVITVNNGRKAVETALIDTTIDLILMDIDLGAGINGPEAARQILQIKNFPIVFLTSHSEQDVVEMVREITRYGYVIKNSGDFVLLSSIEMAFELFNSHERLRASAEVIRESEEKVKLKLESILSPDGDIGEFELEDIVDIKMLQSIMEDFNTVTDICMAIVDVKGKVLVATGWQDICTNFHRMNSDSCRNCVESDTVLSSGIDNGAYKLYKCKNNMWDIATPILVGGKHVANVFMGQFLFDDDVPDYDLFRSQAREFGYDEKEYLAALKRVPRLGKDLVFNTMTFLIKLSNIISKLSYSNIKLAKTLSERDRYSNLHRESEARLSYITDHMVDLVARLDNDGFFTYVSPSYERVLGYRPDELAGTWAPDLAHPSSREKDIKNIRDLCNTGEGFAEFRLRHKDGTYRWFEATGRNIYDEKGSAAGAVMGARDITERKKAEKKLSRKDRQYKELFENMIDGFAIHEIVVDECGNPVDYIFLEVNPAFEHLTGLNGGDIIGKKVTELITDLEPHWIATYGQVALTGVQLTIENYSSQLGKWFKVTAYSSQRGFFATIFEDITDRKKGEELLNERDERYRRLFESVVGYVYTVYIDNGLPVKTVHGPGCEAITGYTPADFVNDPELWYKVIHPDDRGRVILFASDIINKGIFTPVEHRIICRDGSISWVRNTPVPHYDSSSNLIEYDSVIADITERKIAELSLKESREMLLDIINSSPDYIFVKDTDLRLVLCNEVYAAAMNSTPAELAGKNDVESGWGEEFVKGNIQKGIRGFENDDLRTLSGEKVIIESEPANIKGEIHYFDTIKVPLYKNGKITSLLGISRDITERQNTEKEKKAAIDIMRIISTGADIHDFMKSVMVFLKSWSGCEAVGIRLRGSDDFPYFETDGFSEEFVKFERSLCAYDIQGQLLRDDIGNPVLECMCGNIVSGRFDPSKSFFTENGSFWSNCTTDLLRSTTETDRQARTRNRCNGMGYESVALIPLRAGNKTFGLIQLNDKRKGMFTEELINLFERLAVSIATALSEKLIRKELEESEERYRLLVDNNSVSIFLIRNGRFIYSNTIGAERLGYDSADDLKGVEFSSTVSAETAAELRRRAERALNGESNPPMILTIVRPNGTLYITETVSFPINLSDGPAILVMGQDITDKVLIEKKLSESENKFRAITENAPLGVYMTDKKGDCIYANRRWLEMAGLTEEEASGKGWINAIHPDDRDIVAEKWYKSVESGGVWGYEFRFLNRSGKVTWVHGNASAISGDDGEAIGYVGTNLDISEKVEFLNILNSQKEKYRTVSDFTYDWEFWIGADGNMIYCSPSCERITGYTSEEFMHDSNLFLNIVFPEDSELACIQGGELHEFPDINEAEFRIKRKDGDVVWIGHVCRAVYDSAGKFAGRRGSNRDITEQKKILDILTENELRFRNLVEHIPIAYQSLNTDGNFVDVNENWIQLTGYNRSEVIGKSFGDFWDSSTRDLFPERFKTFLSTGYIDDAELSLIKATGDKIVVVLTGRVQKGRSGEFEKTHCIISDITERIESFEKINSLLKEKEMLLSEVHHRIKNNMNTISGLLMLQAASISDPAAVTALNDARSRVQSMMIMYDKLYRSEDYRKMSVKEYLEKFIDDIFVIFENSKQVMIEKDIEDFVLDTKILFPMGIIINELITNAFKYAFPDGKEGKINISVKKINDKITLVIKDNGIGVPDKIAASASGGFGLNLASALSEQIGGEVKIIRDNGTAVEIAFKLGV